MHTPRTEVRFPKILRGMFCPISHKFADETTLVTLDIGDRRIEIKSWATLGSDELRLLLGLLALSMGENEKEYVVDPNISETRLSWLGANGISPKSIKWIGSRYKLLSQSALGIGGADYRRIDTAVSKLRGVGIDLHSRSRVEKFSLIEYASIGKTIQDQSVELQINPLLSTILTVDLKQSDPKLFGYFRLLFSDLHKIPKTGFCLFIYLIIQCRMLELQNRKPVEYSLPELRELLQFSLVREALNRKVTTSSFNRQIKVGLKSVCEVMDWSVKFVGDKYSIEKAPDDWFVKAGFLCRGDAQVFKCSSANFTAYSKGIDRRNKENPTEKMIEYLTWLVREDDDQRLKHARDIFKTLNLGFQGKVFDLAAKGDGPARKLTATL